MSTDPNSGIAYITMYDSTGGVLSNGVQFSGELIAPDEILTVAHGVTDSAGNIRNFGTASLGYDGTASAPGISISSVHVLDNSHSSGFDSDADVTTDFAVIHLSQAVVGATTFSLQAGTPGTYTVTGYPALAGGHRVSATESLTQGLYAGELQGTSLLTNQSSAGASGGAVYTSNRGGYSLGGIVTASGSGNVMMMTALTTADIAQIDAWVYADDSGDAWGSAFAPSTATAGTSNGGFGAAGTAGPAPAPAPTDRLEFVAAFLASAAPGVPGPRSSVMSAVSTAISTAVQQGGTASDIPDAAFLTEQDLQAAGYGQRTTMFMAGVMAGEAGLDLTHAMGFIVGTLGLAPGNNLMRSVAMAGFNEAESIGATYAAPIGDTTHWQQNDLANVLMSPFVGDTGASSLHGPIDGGQKGASTITVASNHHGVG